MTEIIDTVLNFLRKFWYAFLIGAFLIGVILLYALTGENSYIAVHDNLDLFIPQFQMMKNDGTFFLLHAVTDFLNGISRNVLPSEFSLYTVLYMLFPSFKAYIAGYVVKILIAMAGGCLLAYDLLTNEGIDVWTRRNTYYIRSAQRDTYTTIAVCVLASFAYGILNLFPAFGIPFASIPLIIYYLRRVYREPSIIWYALILFYPFLSYFSYHGIFIMGYLLIAIIWLWIRNREFPGSLAISLLLLAVGSIACEYRLFMTMLFSDEATIRTTMVQADLGGFAILKDIVKVWATGMMHADDAHLYLILPVCIIYFVYRNVSYIRDQNSEGIFHDFYNLLALVLAFNSIVYGLYENAAVRGIIEMILPPLKGWQFNRTVFFNPFLWYASFFIVCYRICLWTWQRSCEESKGFRIRGLVYLMMLASIGIIMLQPALPFGSSQRYDDLFSTAYGSYYRQHHDGNTIDSLDYSEFYDTALFAKIKKAIDYKEGEMAVAYGLYPAQLEYNDISTLDGYLGFYSQEYKDEWRKVIAPALSKVPASAAYFDNSGIRCYLYSGTEASIPMYTKSLGGITSEALDVDAAALCDLDCKYIFSRIELTNAADKGLTLLGTYQGEAYTVYVYELSEDAVKAVADKKTQEEQKKAEAKETQKKEKLSSDKIKVYRSIIQYIDVYGVKKYKTIKGVTDVKTNSSSDKKTAKTTAKSSKKTTAKSSSKSASTSKKSTKQTTSQATQAATAAPTTAATDQAAAAQAAADQAAAAQAAADQAAAAQAAADQAAAAQAAADQAAAAQAAAAQAAAAQAAAAQTPATTGVSAN